MNDNKLIDIATTDLSNVTGGAGFKLPFKLPWWLSNEHLVIPAADPPGHTKGRSQMTTR